MGFISAALKSIQGKKEGSISRKWLFDSESEIIAPPNSFRHEKEEYLVFGTKKGILYLLDQDANKIWDYKLQKTAGKIEQLFLDEETMTGIFSTPSIVYGKKILILFGSEDGFLNAVDFKGNLKWKFKTNGSVRTKALIHDINNDKKEEIIFGSGDGNLYLLDLNGKKINQFKAREGIQGSAVTYIKDHESRILFGSDDGYLYCINERCEKEWEFKTEGKIFGSPKIISREKNIKQILFGSEDGNLFCINDDGSLIWNFKTHGPLRSEVLVSDVNKDDHEEIIFGGGDDKVYCLSINGNKIWDFETDFWIMDSPINADIDNDGKMEIIIGSFDSKLYVLDGEGSFEMDYMPGISSITEQNGYHNDIMQNEVGSYSAKKLWQIKTSGMITGLKMINNNKDIIVTTKNGKIEKYCFKRGD